MSNDPAAPDHQEIVEQPKPTYAELKLASKIDPPKSGLTPEVQRNLTASEVRSRHAFLWLKRIEAENEAFGLYHELRRHWSKLLSWILSILVGFEIVLAVAIGLGKLTFHNPTVLDLLVVETFLQIVGLCWLVVHYLFPSLPKTGTDDPSLSTLPEEDDMPKRPKSPRRPSA